MNYSKLTSNNFSSLIKWNVIPILKYKLYLRQLLKNRIETKEKYNNDLLKLNIKKEKAWSQGDITKWELSEEDSKNLNKSNLVKDKINALKMMFHKETISVNNLQRKTGYFNKMCLDEMRRWNKNFSDRIKENLQKCSEEFYEVINDVSLINFRHIKLGLISQLI